MVALTVHSVGPYILVEASQLPFVDNGPRALFTTDYNSMQVRQTFPVPMTARLVGVVSITVILRLWM